MSTTLERPVTGVIAPTPTPEAPFEIRVEEVVFNGTLIESSPSGPSSFIERLAGMLGASAAVAAPEIAPVAPSPEPQKPVIKIPSWVHPVYRTQFAQIAEKNGYAVAHDWYAACNCSGPRSSFLGR